MTRPTFAALGWIIVALGLFVWALSGEPVKAATCDMVGSASFYSEAHQGKRMANGQRFNMNALTAASWFYPLGTKVRVKAGGKSVVVTITDRGPAKRLVKRGRVIDLSKAAFAKLAPTRQGIIKGVCVQRLAQAPQ